MSHPGAKVEVLYSAAEIADRVRLVAAAIAAGMGPDLLVVAVLKGSFIFAADLVRALYHAGMHPKIDFMTLSSYGAGTESSGQIAINRDVTENVGGRQVLLIDDILESGRTLAFARDALRARGAEVKVCVLLDKPGKRKTALEADFTGFVCPDRFVVGYGLDFAHYYRELPYIGLIEGH
jgi:hypoxanthine phosphoribosyltransferase